MALSRRRLRGPHTPVEMTNGTAENGLRSGLGYHRGEMQWFRRSEPPQVVKADVRCQTGLDEGLFNLLPRMGP